MAESKKTVEQLKWIDDPEVTQRPPMDFPIVGHNAFKERILNKTTENLFVPIGLIATTACLTLGLINMKSGNSGRQQLFMRGRILFQGFTLLAMTAGVFATAIRKQFKKEEK